MCTNINIYEPIRPWFVDKNEDEQWGCGYRDDMIPQLKQDLYNKIFTLQDQGEDDPTDTLENRVEIWLNNVGIAQSPVPDNLYGHDYNDERLDCSVRGADMFPEIGELKKQLDILRCE